jgi:hypothetical protein
MAEETKRMVAEWVRLAGCVRLQRYKKASASLALAFADSYGRREQGERLVMQPGADRGAPR